MLASMPALMEAVGGGLRRPVPPNPWGGDWTPDAGELARWGSAIRLTTDQKNQPDTTSGDQMQSIMDTGFPVPLLIQPFINCVDTVLTGGGGIPWQTPIWAQVTIGVGRGTTVINTIVNPPPNPPPPNTFPSATFVLLAFGAIIPAQHVRIQARFLTPAINGETVDVFAAVGVVT